MTTPFVLFPAIAGFPLGVLRQLGVTTAAQIYLVVSVFAVAGVSIIGIFENRFYVLFAEQSIWKYFRIPFFLLNYLLATVFFIPPYLSIPDQGLALEQVYKKLPPDLPTWITREPIFVLATDFTYPFTSILIMVLFIIGENLLFIFGIAFNTKCMARKMTLSKATLRMQRKFLNAIHVQMYTPLLILGVPLIYIALSIYFSFHNQAANNICFLFISFHGLTSTIVMLLIHKSYREVCISIFCYHPIRKTTPVVESRRQSFVTYVIPHHN
uniref:Serpentine Receptor, class H n=1 Tax=Caenorhabditis tropicalis TaxID=1561998 RepID=A0A1I7V1J6_9PELO